MKISLNGFELQRTAEGNLTVGQVLGEVQNEVSRGGKIATMIRLDGKPLPTGWRRRERLTSPVSSVGVMELTVDDPARLKMQMVLDAESLLESMNTKAAGLARKFRIGDEVVANNDLAQFLDELKLVFSTLDHISRANKSASDSRLARSNVMSAANNFVPALDRIYKAQASGDYVSIADEIEYELPNHLAKCMNLLEQEKKIVASSGEVE
jgi:hypothetical protein